MSPFIRRGDIINLVEMLLWLSFNISCDFCYLWKFNIIFGQLCFLIGWNFQYLPLRKHMCDGIVTWLECSVYAPIMRWVIQALVNFLFPDEECGRNRKHIVDFNITIHNEHILSNLPKLSHWIIIYLQSV